MKTITYVLLADGFEEIEALTVVDLFRRAQQPIKTVSMNPTQQVTGSHHIEILADMCFDEERIKSARCLVLPGGLPGATTLRHDPRVSSLLNQLSKESQIGAICAAPYILAELGFLKDKTVTSNPGFKDKVAPHSGHYVQQAAVRDGTIVTSRGMGTAIAFGLELLAGMVDTQTLEQVKKGIVSDPLTA